MTTSGREATVKLLAASQPDIVRASQKDESYVEQYVEVTREVIRRLAGPFRVLQYARESKLLALLLYHGLTTGLGQSTLGEEYCGMTQVAGDGHMPGPGRRLLLALLLSVGPYAADRVAGQLDSAADEAEEAEAAAAAEAGAASAAEASTEHPSATASRITGSRAEQEADEQAGCFKESADPRAGGESLVSEGEAAEGEQLQSRRTSVREAGWGPGSAAAVAARRAASAPAAGRGGRGWLRLLLAAVAARWSRSWRALVLSWPRIRPLLSYAGRLHLALFYAYGAYYSLAHRLSGVRYSLSIRPLQGRPSYGVLGALLGLQLAVVAALQARKALRSLRRESAAAAAAAKRRQARMRRRPGLGPEVKDTDAEDGIDGGGEERFYAGEDEPAVFLDDELSYDDEVEEWDEQPAPDGAAAATEAEASAATKGGGGEGERLRAAAAAPGLREGRCGSCSGGGRSGGGGHGAAISEGWEESWERLDDGWGLRWEADVFGVRPPPPPPALPPLPLQQQLPADGASGEVEPGLSAATTSRRRRRRDAAAGVDVGVLPVLTSMRQCPLCLSPKSHPTSTPCGHTFCWGCITAWCVEKPECPLCRSAVRLPQLVALYHTNC